MKKFIALLLTVVLTATIAVGGTVAYLQDDDSDKNTMTVGSVYIEQKEYQRAEGVAHNAGESGAGNGVKDGALVPFVDGQKIYPAVPQNNAGSDYTAEATDLFWWGDYVYSGTAGNGLWNDNKLANVMDKMVFVKNTGKSDAYFRTIIAIECPEGMTIGEAGAGAEIMLNVSGSDLYEWEDVGFIKIENGANAGRYLVKVATYQKPLAYGKQSHPSLLQAVLTHHADNKDMEALGTTLDILVLSQAVQSEGFNDAETALNTAFGAVTADTAAAWLDEVPATIHVSNGQELQDALNNAGNGDTIILDGDIDLSQGLIIP